MTSFIRDSLQASPVLNRFACPALPCFLVAVLAFFATASVARAEFRETQDGRIAINLDAAFSPSNKFSGFVDKKTGTSFAIIELPADAYEKLKSIADSEEALENEGFGGLEKAELEGREGNYIYLVGEQETPAGEVLKLVLMFGEDDIAGLIVVNVPRKAIDSGTYSREGVEAILANTIVRAPPDPNALFRFDYLGPFRQAFDHGGMTKAYNLSGSSPSGENQLTKEPMLLISSSIHGDEVDPKVQAGKTFNELSGMKDRQITEEKEVTIGDLEGYRVTGEATDEANGNKIAIQIVLLSKKPYGNFMLVGTVPVSKKEKMMPEMEKIIASFELVK